MSSDNTDDIHGNFAVAADSITNGARSDDIVVDICSWRDSQLRGEHIPVSKLDSVLHADIDHVIAIMNANKWTDADVLKAVRSYLTAKRTSDMIAFVQARCILTDHPLSPFVIQKPTTPLTLPPMTSTEPVHSKPVEAVRNRSQSLARAKDLIAQYHLRVFDPAVEPHKYFEWKYDIVDVCNTEDSFDVKIEILTNCLPPLMRLELLQLFPSSSPELLFSHLFDRLDKIYGNIRATRHIEAQFQQCQVTDGESISSFYSRFKRAARYYEKTTATRLSDENLIVAFGSGLRDSNKLFLADLIETGIGASALSFDDYVNRLIYLSSRIPPRPSTDLNAITPAEVTHNKRPRPDDGPHQHRSFRGIGCYRCCQGNHSAVTCPNRVKDFSKRCQRCGSRQHAAPHCKANLTRDCRRCKGKHFESICPVDLPNGRASNNAIELDTPKIVSTEAAQSNHPSFDELLGVVSNCSVELVSVDCCLPNDHIDNNAIFLDVEINNGPTLRGLLDTGSGANFIHPDIIVTLAKQKLIDPTHLHRTHVNAKFGNETHGICDTMITCDSTIDGVLLPSTFFVFPCSPKVIIGRPTLKKLGFLPQPRRSSSTPPTHPPFIDVNRIAVSSMDTDMVNARWIEEIKHNDSLRLCIRFPLFEKILMEPLREPLRPMASVVETIILKRLLRMEEEQACRQTTLDHIPIVVPPVLVDKYPHRPRSSDDAELHSRYRITLDLRGYNKLELIIPPEDQPGPLMFRSTSLKSIGPKKKALTTQFQNSSFDIMRHLPADKMYYFSKVDLTNAYNSVALPRSLQHVGIQVFDATESRYRFFLFNTLSQGWKYSPCFFRMACNYLVDKARTLLDSRVYIDFFQDDILLCVGPDDRDVLSRATEQLVELLGHYSFSIQPNKVITAADAVEFCGYKLTKSGCVPSPKRSKFTLDLKEQLRVQCNDDNLLPWLRKIAGIFQYSYGFLRAAQLRQLSALYESISLAQQGKPPPALECWETAAEPLLDSAVNGLPALTLGAFSSDAICSIILVDANQDSFCAILLKAFMSSKSSEFESDFSDLRKLIGLSNNCGIVCCRIIGHPFDKVARKRSSTYRERVAVLLSVEELRPLLEGECHIICDNANCRKMWHDLEDLGSLTKLLDTYWQFDPTIWWLARDDWPAIADSFARIVQEPSEIVVNSITPGLDDRLTIATFVQAYASDDTTLGQDTIRSIYEKLQNDTEGPNTVGPRSAFSLCHNNLLWFHSRLVVPHLCRASLMWRAHCQLGGVHLGRDRTRCQLANYYWPTMSKDIFQFVKSCYQCIKSKPCYISRNHDKTTSSRIVECHRPFESWQVDHCGPFPDSSYALICVCTVSKYLYSRAVPGPDAQNTAME